MAKWIPNFLMSIKHAIHTFCRMVLLGAIIAGAILVAFDLLRFMVNSSDFTVQEITVTGNRHVDQQAILALSGIAPGTNVWLVDLEELGKRLESHPRIRRVGIQRIPPRRIHIMIEERNPLVLIHNPEDHMLYGLDVDGVMLPAMMGNEFQKRVPQNQKDDIDLVLTTPIMSGDLSVSFEPGAKIANPMILQGLYLLQKLRTHYEVMFTEIAEAEWKTDGNLILHYRRRIGVLVLRDLVSPDLEKKICAFWDALEKNNLRAIYVDARFPEHGFAVRWDESEGPQWKKLYTQNNPRLSQVPAVDG